MLDVLRPIVELLAIIPGVLLAYFPMKHHLKVKVSRLAAVGMPVLILLCKLSVKSTGTVGSYTYSNSSKPCILCNP